MPYLSISEYEYTYLSISEYWSFYERYGRCQIREWTALGYWNILNTVLKWQGNTFHRNADSIHIYLQVYLPILGPRFAQICYSSHPVKHVRLNSFPEPLGQKPFIFFVEPLKMQMMPLPICLMIVLPMQPRMAKNMCSRTYLKDAWNVLRKYAKIYIYVNGVQSQRHHGLPKNISWILFATRKGRWVDK